MPRKLELVERHITSSLSRRGSILAVAQSKLRDIQSSNFAVVHLLAARGQKTEVRGSPERRWHAARG